MLLTQAVWADSQRQTYRDALAKIRAGQFSAAEKMGADLTGYVLFPYLQYHLLNARLSGASNREIELFLQANEEIPVAKLLKRRWLKRLGRSRQWQTLLSNYEGGGDAELNCYYLRALYNTGDRGLALTETTKAWVQPASQPKACDPLFSLWRASPHFTEDVVWQRLDAALRKNEVTLARYLLRYFKQYEQAADLYYQAHVRPERLSRTATYTRTTPYLNQIIAHALPRLARKNPDQALGLWPSYRGKLPADQVDQVLASVLVAAAEQGRFPEVEQRPLITQQDDIAALQNAAVKQQAHSEIIYWSEQLDDEQRNDPSVQYWLAVSLKKKTGDQTRADLALKSLAQKRNYYGFWAARALGVPGQLNGIPVYDQRTSIALLSRQPHFNRSLELFAVGDDINGRREWYAGLGAVNLSDQKVAAEMALVNGRLSLAIRTANHAGATDALHLRFPTAYLPQYRQASLTTNVPVPFLMGVTRQESAWDHDVRSSANARGLMQLLPSTARLVARRFYLPSPSTKDLYDPNTNITLGSHHLAWLLERYDNQAALAIAAYNAGEHRVDRWIRDKHGMPLDAWIETIPFRETRNYVKNVLAFQHVYAQLAGSPLPFLPNEQSLVAEP